MNEAPAADICVIIAALDEEATIGTVVHLARREADRVIVVDDGSRDRTAAVATDAGADVIRMEQNGGKGSALCAGFDAVGPETRVVVTLDGDFQHDPAQLRRLAEPVLLGRADMVVGSRFIDGASNGASAVRRVAQRMFSSASARAGRVATTDSECGFRAFSADLLRRIEVRESGYGVEWAMLQEAGRLDARVVEVPVEVSYEVRRRHNPFIHAWSLVAAMVRFIQRERPLMFLGLPGALSLGLGLLFGYQTASNYYYGDGLFWPGKAMLSLLFCLLGTILLVAGLVLDALARLLQGRPGLHGPRAGR